MKAFAAIVWIGCGLIGYAGQLGYSRLDKSHDILCRQVRTPAVCDARLATDRSFFLVWGIAFGPMSLIAAAATTGFFYGGLKFV